MSEQLKPCPFCGGTARLIGPEESGVSGYMVSCTNVSCEVQVKTYYKSSEELAITIWNKREGVKE